MVDSNYIFTAVARVTAIQDSVDSNETTTPKRKKEKKKENPSSFGDPHKKILETDCAFSFSWFCFYSESVEDSPQLPNCAVSSKM